jgi:cytidylate kinase
MNEPDVEKAGAYLSLHLSHSGPSGSAKPPGPFVTISRESGAGGSAVAAAVAEQLATGPDATHWAVYSANLIDEMLLSAGLPARLARFLPEDRVSEVSAAIGEIVGLHPNLWTLIDRTNELIRRLARDGHAIILGRGGSFVTSTISNGVHVRLVAPAQIRAQRTAVWLGVPPPAAIMHNARRDSARARYVRSNFNADVSDPADYHLVINTGLIPTAAAAEIIAGYVRTHLTIPEHATA